MARADWAPVDAKAQLEIVRCLLAAGARVDHVLPNWSSSSASGETALFGAVKAGNLQIVQALLAAGASASAVESSGRTPLHVAYSLRKDDKRPADGEPLTNVDVLAIIRALEAAGAAGATTPRGFTLLMAAAYSGRVALVADVLAKHPDDQAFLNARDVEGGTAVTIAAVQEFEDVLRLLLSAGADGRPALFTAAGNYCNEAMVQLLLSAGVDGDARDENGRTWQEVLQGAQNRNARSERLVKAGEHLGTAVSVVGMANTAGCCSVQ